AWALSLYVLGLPAHAVVEIVVRAFYAMHDTRTPVAVGVAAMALNVALSVVLIAAFRAAGWMPHGGLALGNSIATTVEMGALLVLIRPRLGGLEERRMAASLARMGASTLLMVAVVAVLVRWFEALGTLAGALLAVGGGAVAYALFSIVTGAREPRAVWSLLRRKQG
ncbi:MAG: lipid II flippase MurJ, partial [Anaerolineae bacterium]